jgi:hypothetical protein
MQVLLKSVSSVAETRRSTVPPVRMLARSPKCLRVVGRERWHQAKRSDDAKATRREAFNN